MVSGFPSEGIDSMEMFSLDEGDLTSKNSFLQRSHSYNFDAETKRIQNLREIRMNASLEQYGHLLLEVTRIFFNLNLHFLSPIIGNKCHKFNYSFFNRFKVK